MLKHARVDDLEARKQNEDMHNSDSSSTSDDSDRFSDGTHSLDNEPGNLDLLASCCLSAVRSDNASEINSSTIGDIYHSNSPEDPVADIATPVPLPYSVRSSAVLESLISGPKETLQHPMTLAEQLERSHEKVEDSVLQMENNVMEPAYNFTDKLAPLSASSVTHRFRPIRPVSPSTLIALTEPFLMAWCARAPLLPYATHAANITHYHPHITSILTQRLPQTVQFLEDIP